MKKVGKQTYKMANDVYIRDVYTIAGTKEGEGPLRDQFDYILSDSIWGEKTWEKAESKIIKETVNSSIIKSKISSDS